MLKYGKILRASYLLLLSLILSSCTHFYSLLPVVQTYPLNNLQQLEINGPFRVQIYTGSPTSKMILAAAMGGELTEISVERYPNKLIISPSHSALGNDINHSLIKIYLKNPKDIVINGVNYLKIVSMWQQSYNLTIKNVPFISFNGNAIFPMLFIENSGNFSPNGRIYLARIYNNGTGNIFIDQAQGQAISIQNNGSGNISLRGSDLGLTTITNEGSGNISVIQATGSPIDLTNKGYGSVKIIGRNIGMRNIVQDGPGNITVKNSTQGPQRKFTNIRLVQAGSIILEGLYTDNLTLNAISSSLSRLSGQVGKLTAEFHGHCQFMSPKLVAYDAYVRTYATSVAQLTVNHRLFANSQDQSRIEYYGLPPYTFVQARDASAILALTPSPGTYTAKFD